MQVLVDQPRNKDRSGEGVVDHTVRPQVRRRADGQDPPVAHRHRGGLRYVGVHGDDAPGGEDGGLPHGTIMPHESAPQSNVNVTREQSSSKLAVALWASRSTMRSSSDQPGECASAAQISMNCGCDNCLPSGRVIS